MPWNSEALVDSQYSLPEGLIFFMTNVSIGDMIMSLLLCIYWSVSMVHAQARPNRAIPSKPMQLRFTVRRYRHCGSCIEVGDTRLTGCTRCLCEVCACYPDRQHCRPGTNQIPNPRLRPVVLYPRSCKGSRSPNLDPTYISFQATRNYCDSPHLVQTAYPNKWQYKNGDHEEENADLQDILSILLHLCDNVVVLVRFWLIEERRQQGVRARVRFEVKE